MTLVAPELAAQELSLKRDLPPPEDPVVCAPVDAPSAAEANEEARGEAQRLADDAARSMILGETARAVELLDEAARLDPASPRIRFQLARALEETGDDARAFEAFCRFLALDPEGQDRDEAERRAERLAPHDATAIPENARSAFRAGVDHFDRGAYDEAVREFSRALVEMPSWSDAHYNRGVAYLRAGREGAGLSDLEQYLELAPDDEEAASVRLRLRASAPLAPNPGTALAVGVLIPGMGHFYGGRTGWGTLYLLGAGASAATGLLYRQVEVQCRTIPGPEGCPQDQIAEERETQPLLVPGLAAAAGLTLAGALHAYLDLQGRRAGASPSALQLDLPIGGAPTLSLDPALGPGGRASGLRATLRFPF